MPGTATVRKVRIVLIPSPLFPATPARPDTRRSCVHSLLLHQARDHRATHRGRLLEPLSESRRLHSLNCPVAPATLSPTVRSSHRVDKLNIRYHPAHGARTSRHRCVGLSP